MGKGHIQGNLVGATQTLRRVYSEDGERFFTVLHGSRMTDNDITLKILFTGKEKAHLIKPISC